MTLMSPKEAEPFYRLSVNLPLSQFERLKAAATAAGEPISKVVRRAIDNEIGEEKASDQ